MYKLAIVVARFNESVTQALLDGALERLTELDIPKDQIRVAWVPGAVELPLIAQKMAESRQYEAVICLGAVIRGETPHFDFVNKFYNHFVIDYDYMLQLREIFFKSLS